MQLNTEQIKQLQFQSELENMLLDNSTLQELI